MFMLLVFFLKTLIFKGDILAVIRVFDSWFLYSNCLSLMGSSVVYLVLSRALNFSPNQCYARNRISRVLRIFLLFKNNFNCR